MSALNETEPMAKVEFSTATRGPKRERSPEFYLSHWRPEILSASGPHEKSIGERCKSNCKLL